MINTLAEALSFGFIQRALVTGCFVAVACASLGVFLVLRRLSLIGDGIAHISFAALALALFFHQAPLHVAIPFVVAASLCILELGQRARMQGDAAIGLVSTFSIAIGVLLASLSRGFNVDLFSYLFGNILAISWSEAWLSVGLSLGIVALTAFLYQDLFSITFDREFAIVSGIRVRIVERLLIVFTAVTVVLGVRLLGTLLISNLIILPAVTALLWARSFRQSIIAAVVVAIFSVSGGILASYVWDLPTGSAIVLLNFALFVLAFVVTRFR